MAFVKGKQKTGGRKKKVLNKKTEQWEVFAEYCLNGGLEKFEQELKTLKSEKYVYAFLTLLEFHKPKLARSQTEIEMQDNTINVVRTIINGKP